jgi:hypothetical protein
VASPAVATLALGHRIGQQNLKGVLPVRSSLVCRDWLPVCVPVSPRTAHAYVGGEPEVPWKGVDSVECHWQCGGEQSVEKLFGET